MIKGTLTVEVNLQSQQNINRLKNLVTKMGKNITGRFENLRKFIIKV